MARTATIYNQKTLDLCRWFTIPNEYMKHSKKYVVVDSHEVAKGLIGEAFRSPSSEDDKTKNLVMLLLEITFTSLQ